MLVSDLQVEHFNVCLYMPNDRAGLASGIFLSHENGTWTQWRYFHLKLHPQNSHWWLKIPKFTVLSSDPLLLIMYKIEPGWSKFLFSLKWTVFYFSTLKDFICCISGLTQHQTSFPLPTLSNTWLWQLENTWERANGHRGLSTGFAFHQNHHNNSNNNNSNNNMILLQEHFERVAIDTQSEGRSLKRCFFPWPETRILCCNAEWERNEC